MVRNLVGTLLEVAGERMPLDCMRTILARGDRRLAGPTAPAHGLCLERIVYDPPWSVPADPVGLEGR
jgi:tRNA pseudouridine38-40 synthase